MVSDLFPIKQKEDVGLEVGVKFVPDDTEGRQRLGGGVRFVTNDAEEYEGLEEGSDLFLVMQKEAKAWRWVCAL